MTLLLMAAGVYFGVDYFRVQMRFYKLQDAVKEKASFAAVVDDQTIRRQLIATSDSMGIPFGPRDWVIKRTYDPRYITIQGQYLDSFVINVPGVYKVFYFKFTPRATSAF
ncbi:MAG: hypothetical protein ACHQU8_08795 [Gemmatimonadales bacterium]